MRILWRVWCGAWALVWLAGAVQGLIDYGQFGDQGASFDMVLDLALCASSVALMWAPVGKRKAVNHAGR